MAEVIFRYFRLSGEPLADYLDMEQQEMAGREEQRDLILGAHPDITGFRAQPFDRRKVYCVIFEEDADIPDGLIPANREQLSVNEVRPHKRAKAGKRWRDLFDEAATDVSCQDDFIGKYKLPINVIGPASGTGHKLLRTRIGHVGDDVFVEVPGRPDSEVTLPDGFNEVRPWEFEKAAEDAEGHDYESSCYTIGSRMQRA